MPIPSQTGIPYNKLATKSMVMDMRHKCNYKFCKNKAVPWLNVSDEPHTITAALTAAVHAAIFEVHAMPAVGVKP